MTPPRKRSTIFILPLLLVLHTKVHAQVAPNFPDIPIEDADTGAIEDFPQGSGSNEPGNVKTRFFTYSTFTHSPFRSGVFVPPAFNFFEEKSALFELSGEVTYNNLKNLAGRFDLQTSYSTMYSQETIYPKNYADRIFLNEIFFEYYASSGFSFLAGKYRMVFAPGVFENPLDRHNSSQASPGEPLERNGVWTAQISQNIRLASGLVSSLLFSAAYLPRLPENRYGFWQPNYELFALSDNPFIPLPERTEKEWQPDDMGGFVRMYANFMRGDLNVIGYYLDRRRQGGVSYGRYLHEALELHGEFAVYESVTGENRHLVKSKELYTDYLAGARIDFSAETGMVLEYLHRDDRPEKKPDTVSNLQYYRIAILNLEDDRGMQLPLSDYALGSIHSLDLADRFDLYFNATYGIAHDEWMLALRGSASVSDYLRLSLFGSLPVGPDDSHYGSVIPFEYSAGVEVYGSF